MAAQPNKESSTVEKIKKNIALILHISNNKKIMGDYTNSRWANILAITSFLLMSVAGILMIWSILAGN